MKITKLELKNFKRFDDLTIDLTSLAQPAKLVLLIGTNGSGKSSVFDGFEYANRLVKGDVTIAENLELSEKRYYPKKHDENYQIELLFDDGQLFTSDFFLKQFNKIPTNAFYGRTSIRQIPKLTRTSIGLTEISFEQDSDRPRTYIDRDNRFENDVEEIIKLVLKDVFGGVADTKEIIESYINPINRAFENIFGTHESTSLKLRSVNIPTEGKTAEILFKKGKSTIPYDQLSSGEKEIFNILLNLLARNKYFQDTVYFLDEIDLHLNTQLQKNLLKEITENWIPDNCQLWTASHSLGFIEYANEAEHAAIIDFDSLNFDIPQIVTPSPKNTADVFEIAVSKEFLSKIFEGKKIVFSENKDTSLYNNLNIADTIFFIGNDKLDVFQKSKNQAGYYGLVDRDYLSDEEREGLLKDYESLHILKYYSIENYLFHPDNLQEYYKNEGTDFDAQNYANAITSEKNEKLGNILIGIARARDGYPFYKDKLAESDKKLKIFRQNEAVIMDMLNSADFETFYKVFPAKDYGKTVQERQNLHRVDLAKTAWFKAKIEEVLQK